jgi:uncharacterized cupin superfamily protein
VKPIVNIADVDTFTSGHGEVFGASHGLLTKPGLKIGASVTRVEPGHAAFPLHHHYGSEEHFFIVSGTGVLRYGSETYPVKPGDYIVHPPGGPENAHQLINTGSETLVYLSIGAMVAPEVVGYPDSGKVGVSTRPWGEKSLRFMAMAEGLDRVEYWEGEDGSPVRKVLGEPQQAATAEAPLPDMTAANEDVAASAAEAWLSSVDAGNYPQSWSDATTRFRNEIDQAQWEKALQHVRAPLGPVRSRKMKAATFKTQLPGAPDGEYVVVVFETTFEKKQNAVETVTPMKESDGHWRVSGYFIR